MEEHFVLGFFGSGRAESGLLMLGPLAAARSHDMQEQQSCSDACWDMGLLCSPAAASLLGSPWGLLPGHACSKCRKHLDSPPEPPMLYGPLNSWSFRARRLPTQSDLESESNLTPCPFRADLHGLLYPITPEKGPFLYRVG